jgi:hypothetical protein
MRSLLRQPLFHFLVLGSLLLAGREMLIQDASIPASLRIAIEQERLEELRQTFLDQAGRRPTPAEIDRMVEAEVDEEILFREAVARGLLDRDGGVQTRLIQKMLFLEGGAEIADAPDLLARAVELELHEEDVVVRRILVQKMRLLGSLLGADQQVTPEEIEAIYERERETLRAPDRLSLVHVFLNGDRRGPRTETDALALRARLLQETRPAESGPAFGDPFPLGHRLARRSQHDLERAFGAHFGAAVFTAATGQWTEPIESAYGLHLVQVTEREAGEVPPLPSVADRLRLQLEEKRREANLEALLHELRARYVIVPTRLSTTADPTAQYTTQEPG